MNKRTKLDNGITLIALVITIIVLLILAGITISTLIGENGVLNKAEKAAEETRIKGYEEKIRLATIEGKSNDLIDPEKYANKRELLVDIGNIIKKDSQFETAEICKTDTETEDIKLVVITKDGYVFDVYIDKTEYSGTKEEVGDITVDIEIKEGDIIFTCEPNSWTNGNVEITIEIANESYKDYEIEYSYDTKNWNKYQKEQKIIVTENNTEIYTRLRSDNIVLGDGANKGIYASYMVKNIDKVEPNETTITLSGTTTDTEGSITATVTQSDSQSGVDIEECRWVLNTNSSTTIDESLYPSANTFDTESQDAITLSQTTAGTYYLHVLTVDNAGNKKQTRSSAITIEESNQAPSEPSTSCDSKTETSITVTATSTDADGDSLTYALYTSTSSSGTFTKKTTATASSGTTVTLKATDLSEYTTYYYYVTVEDGKKVIDSDKLSVRTYCSGKGYTCSSGYSCSGGYTCSGGSTSTSSCSTCGGDGYLKCGENFTYLTFDMDYVSSSTTCAGCGKTITTGGAYYIITYRCPTHLGNYAYSGIGCTRDCAVSTYSSIGTCSESSSCSTCGGDGSISSTSSCIHGYTSSHSSSCSHGYTSSHSSSCSHGYTYSHSYCSHDYTSKHD